MNGLTPFRWSGVPRSFLRDLAEMDRWLEQALAPSAAGPAPAGGETRRPALEAYEKNGALHFRLDLPGVDPKDVEVSVHEDRLTIRGERRDEREEGEDGRYREVSYGSFERSFRLPKGVALDRVEARCEHGILEVVVPLPEAAKPRRIEIRHGEEQPRAIEAETSKAA